MTHRKTCKRFNDPGHAHALTFSCYRRQAFLSKDRSRLWLAEAVERARSRYHIHVWAYVVMPEHAHLLIWPTVAEYDVSEILYAIKKPVTTWATSFVRQQAAGFLPKMEDRRPSGEIHYRFWQRGGGYDRNVVEPGTALRHIEYIHFNPVRRGLCARPEDWYWSSAADYAGLREGPIRVDRESLPRIGP
jgi:putative transposase